MLLDWQRADTSKLLTIKDVGKVLERYRADLVALLNGGFLLGQNAKFAIVDVDCQHGVQSVLGYPRGFKPRAFWPFEAENVAVVSGSANRPLGTFQQLVGNPVLDHTRTDGLLGITVQYAPPLGRVDLLRNATQAAAQNQFTPVQFDTRRVPDLGNLSCDIATTSGTPAVNSRIVCAVAGEVEVLGAIVWDTSIAGLKLSFLTKNNSNTTRWSQTYQNDAGFTGQTHGARFSVVAGDYLQLMGFQSPVASLNILGSTDNGATAQAMYVAPDPSTTARVRGLLVGG